VVFSAYCHVRSEAFAVWVRRLSSAVCYLCSQALFLVCTIPFYVVTRALNAEPLSWQCQLIINEITSRVRPAAPKLLEAGAHREISPFPGGPVRHCQLERIKTGPVTTQLSARKM